EGGKPVLVTNDVGSYADVVQTLKAPAKITDVLPGGQALIVTAAPGISADYADIYVLTLAGLKAKRILQSGYGARFVEPGYLVFARAGDLFAVRFSLSRLEIEGEPVSVAAGVSMESLFGQVHATLSANGVLGYIPGGERANGKLAWVDRQGAV